MKEAADRIDTLTAENAALRRTNDTLHKDWSEVNAENERLREAAEIAKRIAIEAYTLWNADQDSKVGKLLLALAGYIPRYRKDIDAFHATLTPTDTQGKRE